MKCRFFCVVRSDRQCASILGRLSARMKRPPGLVYNSALLSSDIPITLYVGKPTLSVVASNGCSSSRELQISLPLNSYPPLLIFAAEAKGSSRSNFQRPRKTALRWPSSQVSRPCDSLARSSMILGNPRRPLWAAMRSGRVKIGGPRKSDDPERTRDQKRRSD
jgi:hypothetical protein